MRLLCPWNSPGKNTGVGYHARLQWIFLTQGLNPCLPVSPALQADSLPTEPLFHICEREVRLVRSVAFGQSYLEAHVGSALGKSPITAGRLQCGQGHLPGEAVSSPSILGSMLAKPAPLMVALGENLRYWRSSCR